jgi:glycosyltransferase involved in cell wall biosynthesis
MFRRVSGQGAQDLLVIAYAFDPKSMVFSHQYQVICKLAEKFERIYVIANEVDEGAIKPNNVKIFDLKWKSKKWLRNFWALYESALPIMFRSRKLVIFSFMTETHSMLLGPVTRVLRIKHVLWYAHTSSPFRLKVAAKLVDRILTSTQESIPDHLENRTLPIGQMVDFAKFTFYEDRNYAKKNTWIHVGRIDPSKEIEVLITLFIRQLATNPESKFLIVGQATPGNESYESDLRARYVSNIQSGQIVFKGKQSHDQVRELLNQSDLFIHSFRGSLDKSLVEATMSGITVITRNDAYLKAFGGLNGEFEVDNAAQAYLQSQIYCWKNLSDHELLLLAKRRLDIALSSHSINEWIEKLTSELRR